MCVRASCFCSGIDPARIVFQGARSSVEHLRRIRLSDVFLDTRVQRRCVSRSITRVFDLRFKLVVVVVLRAVVSVFRKRGLLFVSLCRCGVTVTDTLWAGVPVVTSWYSCNSLSRVAFPVFPISLFVSARNFHPLISVCLACRKVTQWDREWPPVYCTLSVCRGCCTDMQTYVPLLVYGCCWMNSSLFNAVRAD